MEGWSRAGDSRGRLEFVCRFDVWLPIGESLPGESIEMFEERLRLEFLGGELKGEFVSTENVSRLECLDPSLLLLSGEPKGESAVFVERLDFLFGFSPWLTSISGNKHQQVKLKKKKKKNFIGN